MVSASSVESARPRSRSASLDATSSAGVCHGGRGLVGCPGAALLVRKCSCCLRRRDRRSLVRRASSLGSCRKYLRRRRMLRGDRRLVPRSECCRRLLLPCIWQRLRTCECSQLGYVGLNNGCLVVWSSKVTSVQFSELNGPAGYAWGRPVVAHPRIAENHADMSSAAAEIYAAGTAVMDFLGLSYVASEARGGVSGGHHPPGRQYCLSGICFVTAILRSQPVGST